MGGESKDGGEHASDSCPPPVATFPIEYFKTVSQFAPRNGRKVSPVDVVRETLQKDGVKGLFRGCTALVVGNAGKAGVRFVAFEHFKNSLKNKATVRVRCIRRGCLAHCLCIHRGS